MVSQLTITTKGQVTLRRSVLEHLGLAPGSKVGVTLLPDGRVELRATGKGHSVSELRGALHLPEQRSVSLAEMQDPITRGRNG
jgi:AbrB family looped-hinge helix DNA binding protein